MINAERLAYLKDKLQSWPGGMALTSEDIADLLSLLDAAPPTNPKRKRSHPMNKERIAELRELCKAAQVGYFKDILRFTWKDWADLLALLDQARPVPPEPCANCRGKGIVYSDPDRKQLICGDGEGTGMKPTPPTVTEELIVNFVDEKGRGWSMPLSALFTLARLDLSTPPTAPPAEASCPHCGGSGYAQGGEEEQIKCRTCSGSGIVLRQPAGELDWVVPPAKEKKRPYVDEGQFYDTPEQEALTEERREMANRLRRAVKNSHYADTHLSEDGLGRMGADVMAGADENYRLDLEAIDALLLAPSPPAGEPEKIDTQDLLDKGILLTRRPAAPVRVSRVRAGGTEIGVASIIRDDEVAVVFFRLMESGTPGQSVPRMEVGKTLPDDRILFEIVIPKPEFCMAFINGFCEAWRMLQDREKGVIVEDGEKP